jgi:aspartyl-tRNA(Asn)/glutamyl-tRNA(Gln) amidotransferase subunit A
MTDNDLAFSSIPEIAQLFRKRKLSPVELTKLMLERIERWNPQLNAFITVTGELALDQARKAEKELCSSRKSSRDRGPLHGLPISLKDNIYTAGIRTTAGSKILRDFIPLHDAPVVTQLLRAGAILLGKTNMHEFAYGVTTDNPFYGAARNPWDLGRSPGGSSGGSAAAVAAGLCYGSIGSDTGGSIRIPASLCGIVGIKPGLGRVSAKDVVPLSPRLDCVGPLVRSVQDAALLLDPIFRKAKSEPSLASAASDRPRKRKFKLGLPREFFFNVVSEEVRANFDLALQYFRSTGCELKEVSIPLLDKTESAGNQIAWAEATHYHQQAGWFPARAEEYSDDVRPRVEAGTKVPATVYLQALNARDEFIQQLHLAFVDAAVDALMVPTTPIVAPRVGEESTEIAGTTHPNRALLLRLNRPANLAGVPAVSIPCGQTLGGLPVGLQLIGPVAGEHLLLEIARHYERAHPSPNPPL